MASSKPPPSAEEGMTNASRHRSHRSEFLLFESNVHIRNSLREELVRDPREELSDLVRQCNERKDMSSLDVTVLYERILEVARTVLTYTPSGRYAAGRIDDVTATHYLRHVNSRLHPLFQCPLAERVAHLRSLTYFFTSRVFVDETSEHNRLLEYVVDMVEGYTDEDYSAKSVILEICCAIVAGFVSRAEPTASYSNVVSDAMLCIHKNSLLNPALRYAFQILHKDGNINTNLIFIDHLFDGIHAVWSLIEDDHGVARDGYDQLFHGIMTARSPGKHSSLLIAQFREFESYRPWDVSEFRPRGKDCREHIFHTRPLAKHVCSVCYKDRCRVDGCTDTDPSWMRCSRCTNRYLCSSRCRMM